MSEFKKLIERILKEAKFVGPLYHSTSLKGLLGICKDKKIVSYNPNGISFTRDKNFFYQDYPFMLILDGDAISNNNIIFPYDWGNSHEDFGRRKEFETSVLPGGYKRPDFIRKHNLDFINEKVLKLRDNYILGIVINPEYRNDPLWHINGKVPYNQELNSQIKTPEDVINIGKKAFIQAFPNKEIKDINMRESTLEEGDKKIFDKRTGYNSSEDELYYYDLLKKKWPDTIMSYTDDRIVNPDTHRHFQLDFYIPSEDMAVNIMKHIKHGRRRYNPDDPNCQRDVRWLQSQAKPGNFYEKILHTWKDIDPLKIELAKQGGMKYVDIYNMDEFNNWYNNPELTYEEYRVSPESMQYDSDEYFNQKARHRDIYGNDSKWDE